MLKFEEVKVGSKVICVDAETIWGKLTLDEEYIIKEINEDESVHTDHDEWFLVECDTGSYYWYYPRHFVLAEDYKPEESDVWTTP